MSGKRFWKGAAGCFASVTTGLVVAIIKTNLKVLSSENQGWAKSAPLKMTFYLICQKKSYPKDGFRGWTFHLTVPLTIFQKNI